MFANALSGRSAPGNTIDLNCPVEPGPHGSRRTVPVATRLTIRLENDIGVLARLCRDLTDIGVNLLGLSAHEWGQREVIRLAP